MTEPTSTYGPLDFARDTGVPRETLSRFTAYVNLLIEWNQRMNLVAPSTIEDVWRRHVLDSAQLAPLIPSHARTIVDLGSGAGFPGMVLAIMAHSPPPPSAPPPQAGAESDRSASLFPPPLAGEVAERSDAGGGRSWKVHLIESTQKKCRFLEEVAKTTNTPVEVHPARAEDLAGRLRADIVTARAVAPLDRLLALAHPFFKEATTGLFLKGRALNDELTRAHESWRFASTSVPSRSDPSGAVLCVTGLSPWRSRKQR